MKIYSFYGQVPEIEIEPEYRLSLLWRRRWEQVGFEPIILNEQIAARHPYFAEFDAAIRKLPTVNPAAYERFCYLRWLALAQIGGGWMSDLDVMPNPKIPGLAHELPVDDSKVRIMQAPCCPSLAFASAENALRLCLAFASGMGNSPQGERPHFSDQYALESLVKAQADWIEVHDLVKQYTDKDWEKAPAVHFPNATMQPRGLMPRCEHIGHILDRP